MSDAIPAADESIRRRPKVVTLGGGHGQAALISALQRLDVELGAIVSVADDGGCSGQLRRSTGIPPPGDLRRCLTAIAGRRQLAAMFEERLAGSGKIPRCAGNLVISQAYQRLGSMQAAVDWAAEQLECRGRVIPASETPGVIQVFDSAGRVLSGESHIENVASSPLVVAVHGAGDANPIAIRAIEQADYILFGPGSFFTSVLAAVGTPGIARACLCSAARQFLVVNLASEKGHTVGWSLDDYARMLRDHLTIGSLGDVPRFDLIVHAEQNARSVRDDDGSHIWYATLTQPGGTTHDPEFLASAFSEWFGLAPRITDNLGSTSSDTEEARAEQSFRESLAAALHGHEDLLDPQRESS